jgi:hypothetical protein
MLQPTYSYMPILCPTMCDSYRVYFISQDRKFTMQFLAFRKHRSNLKKHAALMVYHFRYSIPILIVKRDCITLQVVSDTFYWLFLIITLFNELIDDRFMFQ